MGAGASAAADAGVVNPTGGFSDEHFYKDWPFSSVKDAYERVQRYQEEDGTLDTTKAQFFNAFVDHSVFIDCEGDFLKLPMTEFVRICDHEHDKTANVRPIFVLLALLSDGDFDDRMRFLFNIFDLDQSQAINADEMEQMVGLLILSLKLLSRIGAGAPDANTVVKQIKRKAANEGDKDGEINIAEFVEWAGQEADGCGIIIKSDDNAPGNMERKKVAPRIAVKLDAKLSRSAHQRAMKRFGIEAVKGAGAKQAKASSAAINEYAGKDARVKKYAAKADFREKQGKLSAVASKKVMTDLMHTTTFTYSALAELRSEFANAADKTSKKGKMFLSSERFKELLMVKFPSVEDGKMLERVLRCYDNDQNGRIDFEEFVKSLHTFGGANGREGQIDFLMEMLGSEERPVGADGKPEGEDLRSVEFYEIADLMQDALDDSEEVGKYLMEQVGHLEVHEGGEPVDEAVAAAAEVASKKKRERAYKREQVQRMISKEPMYLHFLWVYLPPVFPAMNTVLTDFFDHVEKEGYSLELEGALALGRSEAFSSTAGATRGVHSISFSMFWEEMQKVLTGESNEEAKNKLQKYFDLMKNPDDKNHLLHYTASAEITAEHLEEDHADAMLLWSGIAKFIATRRAKAAETEASDLSKTVAVGALKADDKTKILYALMTWNSTVFRKPEGPPSISGENLGEFVSEALRRVRASSENLSNMLDQMDENCDGQISVPELRTLSEANPDLFLMLLGV